MIMPHYATAYQENVDPGREPEHSGQPSRKVRRERIPTFVDQLDCLLTVWVAEATLDSERGARLDPCDVPDTPLRPQAPATGRTDIAAWSRV
jgi:hypothetical protein